MSGFAQTAAAGPVLLALGVCVVAGLVSFALMPSRSVTVGGNVSS